MSLGHLLWEKRKPLLHGVEASDVDAPGTWPGERLATARGKYRFAGRTVCRLTRPQLSPPLCECRSTAYRTTYSQMGHHFYFFLGNEKSQFAHAADLVSREEPRVKTGEPCVLEAANAATEWMPMAAR